MNAFLASISGRILALTAGLTLLGGGISVLLGPMAGTPVMCVAMIIAVLGATYALGLGVGTWDKQVLAGVIALPGVFFVYMLALDLAVKGHVTLTGYAFITAGLLAISSAMLRDPEDRSSYQGTYRIAHRSV
jgi:hypothetical protein